MWLGCSWSKTGSICGPKWAILGALGLVSSAEGAEIAESRFPPALTSYLSAPGSSLWEVLRARIDAEPLHLIATILFFLAILHTFLAPLFLRLSHRVERAHRE